MSFKRKTSITIAEKYTVTIDAEDAERIEAQTWRLHFGDQGREQFVTTIGSDRMQPVEQLLGSFILGVNVYVEQIDRGKTFDYRKSNLRVYKNPRAT